MCVPQVTTVKASAFYDGLWHTRGIGDSPDEGLMPRVLEALQRFDLGRQCETGGDSRAAARATLLAGTHRSRRIAGDARHVDQRERPRLSRGTERRGPARCGYSAAALTPRTHRPRLARQCSVELGAGHRPQLDRQHLENAESARSRQPAHGRRSASRQATGDAEARLRLWPGLQPL